MAKIKDLPKTCGELSRTIERPREKLEKTCVVCGKNVKVILYSDKTYRGGHYFGRIPLYGKEEIDKAIKSGSQEWRFGNSTLYVFNKCPKPYKFSEYWECPKCYWKK